MTSTNGYQIPAASTWPEPNAGTTVEGSIGTTLLSSMVIPASSSASRSSLSPAVP
ncbi:hypothetical protein [Salipiger thiooxidans]|uniref:hypothetical protein n=1 Tax=Salipiger thiooxidans TaxID=282683 RepID=UPI0013F4E7E9|nr:hypothetical protein [Salipiger thiooxidans]